MVISNRINTSFGGGPPPTSSATPFGSPASFGGKSGFLVLDQLRVIDRERLVRHLGRLPP